MAAYLAALPADPRAGKDGKDKAKAPPEKDKAKAQQQAQDRPKAQPTPKGKAPEGARSEPSEPLPETRVETFVPKLEPFEE